MAIFLLSLSTVNLMLISDLRHPIEIKEDEYFDQRLYIKNSGYWNLTGSPIFINGTATGVGAQNWTWAVSQDWCSGSGVVSDPYLIENVTIDGQNSGSCISIVNSNSYVIIRNCTLYDSGASGDDSGLFLNDISNIMIEKNDFSSNYQGIFLEYGVNNIIDTNEIIGNTVGIHLKNCNFSKIISNNLTGNLNIAIWNDGCINNTYYDNIMTGGNNGLNLGWYSSGHNITKNYIYDHNGIGININAHSDNNFIDDNRIIDCRGLYGGIVFNFYCDYNTISNNYIEDVMAGIYMYGMSIPNKYACTNNEIIDNIIYNTTWGISLHACDNNLIKGNVIKNCTAFALSLEYKTGLTSVNNKVYGNAFYDNNMHIFTRGINTKWNSTTIGNYWDNYTGSDADGDGIGDTPHNITHSGSVQDKLPIFGNPDHQGQQIHIDGSASSGSTSWAWQTTRLWCTGSGTELDPYVIKDVEIDMSDAGHCIHIEDSNVYFQIKDCTLIDSGTVMFASGIFLDSVTNGEILNNNFPTGNFVGIGLRTSDNNTIKGNLIENSEYGVVVEECENNQISANDILNSNSKGIYLYESCSYNTISNNFINNTITNTGIHLYASAGSMETVICSHNRILHNTINYGGHYGIHIEEWIGFGTNKMQYIEVTGNSIDNHNSGAGILLSNDVRHSIISSNDVKNAFSGIVVNYGTNITIINNEAVSNSGFGIALDGATNCKIYYNYVSGSGISNANDDAGTNSNWDDGYAGNYWGDYGGSDTSPKDGIGDSSYTIPGTTGVSDIKPLYYSPYEDMDGDRLGNYEEYILGEDNYRTNVTNVDSEGDGVSDYFEWLNGTDPWDSDTDHDNMPDLWEIFNMLNATDPSDTTADPDSDNLLNLYEYLNNTNPNVNDTDGDNLLDGDEALGTLGYITNATNIDTELDGLRDDYEYGNNTNPLEPDTDYDTIWDLDEIIGTLGNITLPYDNDTDNDKLRDDYEYGNFTDPLLPDTDGDNLLDGDEIYGTMGYITNATNADTDYDSFNDDTEINLNTNPLIDYWYPMPNLYLKSFTVSNNYVGEAYTIHFTIENNGIWDAPNVVVIISYIGIELYNNTASPFSLNSNTSRTIDHGCPAFDNIGDYLIDIFIDPNDITNETYSYTNGSARVNQGNDDNTPQHSIEITERPDTGGQGFPFWIIQAIVGGILSAVGGITVKQLYSRAKKKKVLFELAKKKFNSLKNPGEFLQDKLRPEEWERFRPLWERFEARELTKDELIKQAWKDVGDRFIDILTV